MLGEPITGEHRFTAEARSGKGGREARDGLGIDRLTADPERVQASEVVGGALLGGDPAHREIEREGRRERAGRAITLDGVQPALRRRQERSRRHLHGVATGGPGGEHRPDEAHIVIRRRPADHAREGLFRHTERQTTRVVQEVGVTDHHPFGVRGRARGVLQQGNVVGRRLGELTARAVSDVIDDEPREVPQPRRLRGQHPHGAGDQARGEHQRRLGVARHARQARQRPVQARRLRRISGDGDDPRIEAPEERLQEGRARLDDDERAVAGPRSGQDGRGDGARPSLQLRVAIGDDVIVGRAEKGQRRLIASGVNEAIEQVVKRQSFHYVLDRAASSAP